MLSDIVKYIGIEHNQLKLSDNFKNDVDEKIKTPNSNIINGVKNLVYEFTNSVLIVGVCILSILFIVIFIITLIKCRIYKLCFRKRKNNLNEIKNDRISSIDKHTINLDIELKDRSVLNKSQLEEEIAELLLASSSLISK